MQLTLNNQNRALIGISFGHFIVDLYAAILIPLYPIIAQKLKINIASISMVIALGYGISSVLQPLFGHISDKIAKRFFMFFGLIFSCLFMPLGFYAKNEAILTLCLLLGIIGNAFYHPQTTKILKNFYEENNKLSNAIGIFLGLGTIGYAFGPYISTYFLEKFGNNNYIFIAIFGLITAIFMLYFVPKINCESSKIKIDFICAIKGIIKNKPCVFLIIVTVVKALLVMSFGTYIPFLLKKYNFSVTNTGLIMTTFYIMGGISMIISAKVEKFLKLKGMILASYLPLLPITISALYFLKINPIISVILFILDGFFVLLAAGVVLAQAQRLIPNNTGTISGIIQGFTLSLGSLLLIPCGLIAQKYCEEYVLLLVTCVAFLIGIVSIKTKIEL